MAEQRTVELHGGPLDGETREIEKTETVKVKIPGQPDSVKRAWPGFLVFDADDDGEQHYYEARAGSAFFVYEGTRPKEVAA